MRWGGVPSHRDHQRLVQSGSYLRHLLPIRLGLIRRGLIGRSLTGRNREAAGDLLAEGVLTRRGIDEERHPERFSRVEIDDIGGVVVLVDCAPSLWASEKSSVEMASFLWATYSTSSVCSLSL